MKQPSNAFVFSGDVNDWMVSPDLTHTKKEKAKYVSKKTGRRSPKGRAKNIT